MSNPSKVGDNPNDKMPAGTPLEPDRVVSEDDAGSAELAEEARNERDDRVIAEEFEGLDNDLVNVGKFADPASEPDDGSGPDDGKDRPEPPEEPAIERSNSLQKP